MFAGLPRPLLFAHRGASVHAPENTMEAFALARQVGAPVLELDLRLTADGQVVVFHDERLERVTDGHGPISKMTHAALCQLDAGYHFCREGRYLFRGRGLKVPRLAEVFRAFPDAGFNIELKQGGPAMIEPVVALLSEVDRERVVLTAGDDRIMAELEAARPPCALGLSRRQVAEVILKAYWGRVPAYFCGRALQIPLRHQQLGWGRVPITTRRVVRAAQATGLEVHLWTIDEVTVARQWLDRGVDGIMTNDPVGLGPLFDSPGASPPKTRQKA